MPEVATDTPKRRRRFKEKKYPKRVNRAIERGLVTVAKATEGYTRPQFAAAWIKAVFQSDELNSLNAQARQNIRRLVVVMANSVDVTSMTIKPGWDYLVKTSGLSRSTVNRIRQRLHDARFLVTVAKGRQAKYADAGPDGKKINERAIYALTLPEKPVEKSEPATANFREIPPRTRAGASVPQSTKAVASPRADFEALPEGQCSDLLPQRRKVIPWSSRATPKSAVTKGERREAERQVALMLQERFFLLRRTSAADVATRCREFFLAGWSAGDIAHALQFLPGGESWHGADQVKDVGRWMKYRLEAWKRDGTVIPSATQRTLARSNRVKAQRRAELEQRALRMEQQQKAAVVQQETNRIGAAIARAVLRGVATITDTGEVAFNASSV